MYRHEFNIDLFFPDDVNEKKALRVSFSYQQTNTQSIPISTNLPSFEQGNRLLIFEMDW